MSANKLDVSKYLTNSEMCVTPEDLHHHHPPGLPTPYYEGMRMEDMTSDEGGCESGTFSGGSTTSNPSASREFCPDFRAELSYLENEELRCILEGEKYTDVLSRKIHEEMTMLEASGFVGPSSGELEWLNTSERDVKRRIMDLAEEIERATELECLYAMSSNNFSMEPPSVFDGEMVDDSLNIHDLLARDQAEGGPFMTRDYYSPSPESVAPEDEVETLTGVNHQRKSRLCRHFLKGHCKRGAACDFLHDKSIFCPDEQKVFLGGLPMHLNSEKLCQKLAKKGFTVLNKPKVLRGFTPQVCLRSVDQAEALTKIGKIEIDGVMIDVRPYQDKKPQNDIKRSIFLGGLGPGTTPKEIVADLRSLGVKVCNLPILKAGFTPQVVLKTPEMAKSLIARRTIPVGGKMVEVRPYVNFRKRY